MSTEKWSAGRPMVIGMITLFILVGGLGAWSVKTQISGAIIASGKIEVDQNRQVVQHPDGGVVDSILVEEGDTVAEGDILIRLDPTLLASELHIIEGQLFELVARRGRLEAERDSSDTIEFEPELLKLADTNEDVLDQVNGQQRLFQARRDSIEKEVEQLGKRRNQIADQIIGIDAQMAAMDVQLDLIHQELELAEQRRSLIERLSRLDIRAPVSGIVYGLQVFAKRSVIRPADPVLFLVPQDKPLVIMAQVEPIHIDEIFVNQDVTLRFSALDSRTTPELFGRVVQISADAFQDENTAFSYYRAEIELNEGEMTRLPDGTILIPGMPVEAYIQTADRTPLAYLIKPLADYFAKAFRES